NSFLDKEKFRANEILLKLELQNKTVTCDLFRNAFCRPEGTNKFHEYFLAELEKRKKLIAYDTYRGYKVVINKVNEFKPNLVISDIDFKFLSRFENHLLTPIKEG
ncbi:MAG TPA: phage integrase SAM-like domain-containing protein, partial [Candidatus Berkiella sp.]|nr:phage integrase SAM-like domain-containing protein [Candidatus Berkiella sp.]